MERIYNAANWEDRKAENNEPLYEVLADALDLTDPELWKSNSFARLRDRLIINVRAAITELEAGCFHGTDRDRRLNRARAILETLLQAAN